MSGRASRAGGAAGAHAGAGEGAQAGAVAEAAVPGAERPLDLALVLPGGVDESGERRVIPVLLALIERLAARHRLRVFALDQYPEAREYRLLGARVVNLGRPPPAARHVPGRVLWWRYRALRRALRAEPVDLVHAFWASEPGWLATAAAPPSVPTLVSLAGGELVALPEVPYGAQLSRRARWLVGRTLARAGLVTCASGPMAHLAEAHGRVPVLVPLGVEPPREAPPAAPADPRLLFVGSLNRVKDPFTLLQAMRQVADAEPRARLDLVGEDTLNGAVQRRTAELGLEAYVTFHEIGRAHV